MTKDKMVGRHHLLSGHKFEQTPGEGQGQGSLACCSPWGRKESDMRATAQQVFGCSEGASIHIWTQYISDSPYPSVSLKFLILK